uniref:Uncharacterized protein n=1 Tax=Meloidogyne hapla TaxID=6305 RepID=A0A1I8BW13_MELHA
MNQTLKQRKTIPNELVALRKNEIIDEYLSLKKQTAEMAAEIFILTLRLLMLKLNNHAYSQRLGIFNCFHLIILLF